MTIAINIIWKLLIMTRDILFRDQYKIDVMCLNNQKISIFV